MLQENLCLLLLLIASFGILKGQALWHRTTPKPRDPSCTSNRVDHLTCFFNGGTMCNYTERRVGNGRLHLVVQDRYDTGRKTLDISEFRSKKARIGDKVQFTTPIIDPSVEAICISIHYEAVGYPWLRVYNEMGDGSLDWIGSDAATTKGKTIRMHGCVAPQSFLTMEIMKRDDFTTFQISYISVDNSTMNCTAYRERWANHTGNNNTNATSPTPSTTTPSGPVKVLPTSQFNKTTSHPTNTCTGTSVSELTCDFQKDLCGYSSQSAGNASLEWRRDYDHTKGISARLFDATLTAPMGTEARLKSGIITDPTTRSVCIQFAYWGLDNTSVISVINEQQDGSEILIGRVTADNPTYRKLARFNACVSTNSSISIAASKTSKDSMWVWIDDLKVTNSDQHCPVSSSSRLTKDGDIL